MTDNLPVPDDAPWLKHAGLSPEEVEELRKQKYEITEYAKEKLRELMEKQEAQND